MAGGHLDEHAGACALPGPAPARGGGALGGRLTLIRTAAELERFRERRAREPGIVAGLLALEGLHPIEGELANLDTLFAAGYRMAAPSHFFDNEVGGSAHGIERGGLTPLGREVIARMERLGMIVDLAHAAPRTVDDVLARATRPVVVSHTGVQATCPGPRNLSDDQLRRIAAGGGVVGIGFWEGAVCGASAAAIVRAMRHAAAVMGVEHVALGSDWDGTIEAPFDAAGLAGLTRAMLAAGFSEPEIAAILGGNVARLLRELLPPGE